MIPEHKEMSVSFGSRGSNRSSRSTISAFTAISSTIGRTAISTFLVSSCIRLRVPQAYSVTYYRTLC